MAKLQSIGTGAGDEIELGEIALTFGRESGCEVAIADPQLSRKHLVVEPSGSGWQVRDLGSRNGTRVNGNPVQVHPLSDQDVIQFGSQQYRFVSARPAKASKPAASRGGAAAALSPPVITVRSESPKLEGKPWHPWDKRWEHWKPDESDKSLRAQIHRKGYYGVFGPAVCFMWPVGIIAYIGGIGFLAITGTNVPAYIRVISCIIIPVNCALWVVLAPIGWHLGDLFRRHNTPDAIMVRGGMVELFQAKMAIRYGPQWTGLLFAWLIALAPQLLIVNLVHRENESARRAFVEQQRMASESEGVDPTGAASSLADPSRSMVPPSASKADAGPAPDSLWYARLNDGSVLGPVSYSELAARLADGGISRTTLVCPVGGNSWQPFAETKSR